MTTLAAVNHSPQPARERPFHVHPACQVPSAPAPLVLPSLENGSRTARAFFLDRSKAMPTETVPASEPGCPAHQSRVLLYSARQRRVLENQAWVRALWTTELPAPSGSHRDHWFVVELQPSQTEPAELFFDQCVPRERTPTAATRRPFQKPIRRPTAVAGHRLPAQPVAPRQPAPALVFRVPPVAPPSRTAR